MPAAFQIVSRASEQALTQRWHEQVGVRSVLKVAGPPRRTA
jgi:hypothetical protein